MTSSFPYRQIIDGLRLAASDFSVQCRVLPDFANVPDEVLLGVDIEYVEILLKNDELTPTQAQAIRDYDAYANTRPDNDNYADALQQLEYDPWFGELRVRARALLGILGKPYEEPCLSGITFVR